MSQLDEKKEFIGYLKVGFAVLSAIIVSLIGWLFQNILEISQWQAIFVATVIIVFILFVYLVNRKILKLIKELKDL